MLSYDKEKGFADRAKGLDTYDAHAHQAAMMQRHAERLAANGDAEGAAGYVSMADDAMRRAMRAAA